MITDYETLTDAISAWSHRDDLSTQYDTFIALAENEMYHNQIEPLQIKQMETILNTTTVADSKYLTLPSDYESSRNIRLAINGGQLQYQTPEQLQRLDTTGKPFSFSVIGSQIEFNRTPDSVYDVEIQYYARPTNIDAVTTTTNAVLTNYPSVYLYGALAQLFFNAQDEEQAVKYDRLFVNAIRGANKSNKKGRYGPAPTMQTMTSAP